MPVRIGAIEEITQEEFQALRRTKATRGNPEMLELLQRVQAGQAVRVPLEGGQSARGLRVAISRAAKQLGLSVETIEGDGFVAVSKAPDGAPSRGRRAAPSGNGRRTRGRRGQAPATDDAFTVEAEEEM